MAAPKDAVEIGSPPAVKGRLLAALSRVGKNTAMAVANSVGALTLALVGPHTGKTLEAEYRVGLAKLSEDTALTDKIGQSAFDGLLEMMRRSDLPGKSAQQRLDFVMWATDSNRDSQEPSWKKLTQIFNHFHPESAFVTHANDRGFAHDVADGRKWYNPEATGFIPDVYHGRIDQGSPQVGHFLTAVDIGRQPAPLERILRTAALGHELTGDDQGAVKQMWLGFTHHLERALFGKVIESAERGDRSSAHRYVEQALPDLTDSGQEIGRVGNSRQDLLNTSFGFAFGRMIRSGEFGSREEAANWLENNVGSKAASLAWNDPA